MRKYLVYAAILAALVGVTAGCSSDSNTSSEAASSSLVATTSSSKVPSSVVTTEPEVNEPPKVTRSTTVIPAPPPQSQPSSCSQQTGNWSILDDSTESHLVSGGLFDVTQGHHDCFDRIVIAVDTPDLVGFHVGYVDGVVSQGKGEAVPVAGGAVLDVVIDAPVSNADLFNGLGFVADGWSALREYKYAGSFEGVTEFAVGTSAKLPFAVYHLPTPDGKMRVVIDIAHS